MAQLRLIRPINLLIIGVTQSIIYFCYLIPLFSIYEITPSLDPIHFILFISVTILITASGYVINDICDEEIDKINKPDKVIVGKLISKQASWRYYYAILSMGAILSAYLAYHVAVLPLFLIYPVACIGLYWYAIKLKKSYLVGNLIVATFCAFVPGVVIFAERHGISLVIESYFSAKTIYTLLTLYFYMVFAFLTNMMRELVKDMQDMQGDQTFGAKTVPIVSGLAFSKVLTNTFTVITFLSVLTLLYWLIKINAAVPAVISIIFILIPLIALFVSLRRAESSFQFSEISSTIKMIMGFGLILLYVLSTIIY